MRWIQRPARQQPGRRWSHPPVPLLALAALAVVGLGARRARRGRRGSDSAATRPRGTLRSARSGSAPACTTARHRRQPPAAGSRQPRSGPPTTWPRCTSSRHRRREADHRDRGLVRVADDRIGPERTSTPTSACRRRLPSGYPAGRGRPSLSRQQQQPVRLGRRDHARRRVGARHSARRQHRAGRDADFGERGNDWLPADRGRREVRAQAQARAGDQPELRRYRADVLREVGYAAIRNLRGAYELANAITSPCSLRPATRARRATSTTWWTSTPPARFPGRPPTRSSPLSAAPS